MGNNLLCLLLRIEGVCVYVCVCLRACVSICVCLCIETYERP